MMLILSDGAFCWMKCVWLAGCCMLLIMYEDLGQVHPINLKPSIFPFLGFFHCLYGVNPDEVPVVRRVKVGRTFRNMETAQ